MKHYCFVATSPSARQTAKRFMDREAIIVLATRVLSGEIDPLEGCRLIVRRQRGLSPTEASDPALLVLVGIESDTDHFPLPETRHLWAPEALVEQDEARSLFVEENKKYIFDACRELIARFSVATADT